MLDTFDAEIVGISVDGVWCHRAFAQQRRHRISAPLRFRAEGQRLPCVRGRTGKLRESASGRSSCWTSDGAIRWSYRSPINVNPGADGILRALRGPDRAGGDGMSTTWESFLTVPVTPERDHITGRPDAPLTMVEYGDYECPFCGMAYPVTEQIIDRLGDDLLFAYHTSRFRRSTLTPPSPRKPPRRQAARDGSGRCTACCT